MIGLLARRVRRFARRFEALQSLDVGRALHLSVAVLLLLTNAGYAVPAIVAAPAPPSANTTTQGMPFGVDGGGALHLEPPPTLSKPEAVHVSARPEARSAKSTPYIDALGIPRSALRAYRESARQSRESDPQCGLDVALLAAIGRVESNHARGGNVDAKGTTRQPIIGPQLNGQGFAAIRDTDGGRYDGDPTWDHAVGPMQFIPSTWARWSADGNGDGVANPHNLYDATLASGNYLCAGERNLRQADGLQAAILSYNHSTEYLHIVLQWMRVYSGKAVAIPDQRASGKASNPSRPTSTDKRPADEAPANPKRREEDQSQPPTPIRPASPGKPSDPKDPGDDQQPAPADPEPIEAVREAADELEGEAGLGSGSVG